MSDIKKADFLYEAYLAKWCILKDCDEKDEAAINAELGYEEITEFPCDAVIKMTAANGMVPDCRLCPLDISGTMCDKMHEFWKSGNKTRKIIAEFLTRIPLWDGARAFYNIK